MNPFYSILSILFYFFYKFDINDKKWNIIMDKYKLIYPMSNYYLFTKHSRYYIFMILFSCSFYWVYDKNKNKKLESFLLLWEILKYLQRIFPFFPFWMYILKVIPRIIYASRTSIRSFKTILYANTRNQIYMTRRCNIPEEKQRRP